MFIPCDHCLRKHATRIAYHREEGNAERLQLCGECYRKFRRDSINIPATLPKPRWTEQEIAAGLQAALLPQTLPKIPGYDISAFSRPARQVAGDYYDFFEIRPDHQGLLVADVSGKGIPAAIIMTETKALLKSEAVRSLSPARALHRVNRELYKDIQRGMFVTMFYAVLEPRSSTLTCASAGHNPMVLWRKESNNCQFINPNGLALGVDKGPLFEKTLQERSVRLSKGDRFALYTDGVTESMNREKEQFGEHRFYLLVKRLADRSSSDFLSLLTTEIDAHRGEASQHDDVTILTGRVV
jgi:sigma-B regulation protein RsbU (phosphoserine phosphatase)